MRHNYSRLTSGHQTTAFYFLDAVTFGLLLGLVMNKRITTAVVAEMLLEMIKIIFCNAIPYIIHKMELKTHNATATKLKSAVVRRAEV